MLTRTTYSWWFQIENYFVILPDSFVFLSDSF